MSLKLFLEFGTTFKKDVVWYKELMQFPKVVFFKNRHWEWSFWDKDHGGIYDHKLFFKEIKDFQNQANMYGLDLAVPDLDQMFSMSYANERKCECGAKYDRDFPQIHSYWCYLYVGN